MQSQLATSSRAIRLETADYVVRDIQASDIGPDWGEWLADPATASNLNAAPRRVSEQDLRAYLASFNRSTSHLLGIFEKRTDRLVGIRSVYLDFAHSEFLVNVLIGEIQARGKGARTQSREAVYRYFFEEIGLQTARASVVSTNEAVLAGMAKRGWVHEHTSRKPSATGQGPVELRHFRLTREAWRAKIAHDRQNRTA